MYKNVGEISYNMMNLRTVLWNRPQQRLLRKTTFFLTVCDWIVTVATVSAVYNQTILSLKQSHNPK